MGSLDKVLEQMRRSPKGVKYSDFVRVCKHYFGDPRQSNGSHLVFKTPWAGDPRVNIQDKDGEAKPYQVRQVLKAIDKLQAQEG